ncbi:MAG TPA: M1 family aminopeptidase, partial [Candidatus Eisenbacteria bacterium]|nr:M1 family aminopeptidase [Candidatus Eisenbacteria bacterium]
MVVYDDRGWVLDPYHFFAEFYGEFATYDVAITLPDEQWVGATGVLESAGGGDNEVPLQFASKDSVSIRVRVAVADSAAGRWPSGALRLEPLHGEPIRVPRDSAAVWRVPAGAPVHYRYAWADSAATEAGLERDDEGRRGPVRLLIAARDTTVADTIRAVAFPPPRTSRHAAAAADSALPSLKTLRFHAERVHDFAFVTAPDYVRADSTWNGVAIRSLLYREDADAWRKALVFTVDAFRHHSDLVGPYIWPQFTCAESFTAGGAMEYPMLIMNDPDLSSGEWEYLDATIAHELGHNWFYGMLANDERLHPWLDEGFTQFLESHYVDPRYPRGAWKYRDRVRWAAPARWYQGDETMVIDRHFARDEVPPAAGADDCRAYPQYGVMAYDRPAAMLRTFEGIVGEETFRAFLGEIYRRRVGEHLVPSDVTAAARAATGVDYGDYFRGWTETTEVPDFALGGTRREKSDSGYRTTVIVRRKGGLAFPVPVEARYADGTRETKLVPTPAARNEVVFEHASPLEKATLDPRHQVFDVYRLDNQGTFLPPMRVRPLLDVRTTDAMSVLYGPTVWYGVAEGMRLGGWIDGRYLPGPDFPRGLRSFEGGLNVGTNDGSVAWRLGYARRVGAIGARGSVRALATRDAGLTRGELTVSNWITAPGRRHPWWSWALTGQYLDRDAEESFGGPGPDRVDPAYWSPGRTANLGATLGLQTRGPRRRESFSLEAWHGFDPDRTGGGDASYDRVSLEAKQTLDLGGRADFHLSTRIYGGVAGGELPLERHFDGVEATRLETLDRFYANDRGPLRESDHYSTGGGGGVRGYVGEPMLGTRIAAANLEFRHDRWPLSLFVDTARLRSDASGSQSFTDAGIGIHLGYFRLDLPFWVSRPP